MPEPTTEAIAAGAYRPEIVTLLTYDDATITWRRTPTDDRAKFKSTIRNYAEDLRATYRVTTELDEGDLRMRLEFKGASSATDRQIMKGHVFMIIGDTIWGGGGS